MIKVQVEGDVKNALRKLKKLVERDGIAREIIKHEYFEKKSQKNRRKEIRRQKTIKKALSLPQDTKF